MKSISKALGESFGAISEQPAVVAKLGGHLKTLGAAGFMAIALSFAGSDVAMADWTNAESGWGSAPQAQSTTPCQTKTGKAVVRVLSGILGGAIGSQIGSGTGKTVATTAGAIIGSEAGNYACSDTPEVQPASRAQARTQAPDVSAVTSSGATIPLSTMGADFYAQLDGSKKPTRPLSMESRLQMKAAFEKLAHLQRSSAETFAKYQQAVQDYDQRHSPAQMMAHEISQNEEYQMVRVKNAAGRDYSQASDKFSQQAILTLKGFNAIAASGQDIKQFQNVHNVAEMIYDAGTSSQAAMGMDSQRYSSAQAQRSGNGSVSVYGRDYSYRNSY